MVRKVFLNNQNVVVGVKLKRLKEKLNPELKLKKLNPELKGLNLELKEKVKGLNPNQKVVNQVVRTK
tara:strand:- start:546 stop:746 length:201 start_codon:yes stop_codon:yes gene_type:complete